MAVRGILWEKSAENDKSVRCKLCSHHCGIAEGANGRCRVRVNRAGVLYSLSSDRIVAANADPVEKKPLFHFLPGTATFSLGTIGCNMACAFCQNHTISQSPVPSFKTPLDIISPQLVRDTVSSAVSTACKSVSFTYNEPTVSMELIRAVAPLARDTGLETILVSNGYSSREAMKMLAPLISAANFDLKSFSDDFYRQLCGATLAPVLRTIAQAVAYGWWVEITTLLIPGHNDSDEELTRLARFIKEDLGEHVPWHISRFRPMYRMQDVHTTPLDSLERAHAIGLAEGLRFVYTGNVAGHDAGNTFCPGCGKLFIERDGYRVSPPAGGTCAFCETTIPGVWRNI